MDCAASCAVMSQFNCSLADNFCSWCGLGCVAKDTCSCENITDVFQCTASADCVWCDRCRSFDDCARHAADTLIIIVSCTLGGIFLLCCVAVIVIVVAQRSRRARAGQIVVNNASYGATPASTYPGVAYRAQPAASVPQQQQQQQQRGQMPYVQPAYGAPAPLPAQPTPTPSAPAFVGQAAPTDRTPLMSGVDAI